MNNDLYAAFGLYWGAQYMMCVFLFYELSIMHVCPWSYEIYYVLFFHHAKVRLKRIKTHIRERTVDTYIDTYLPTHAVKYLHASYTNSYYHLRREIDNKIDRHLVYVVVEVVIKNAPLHKREIFVLQKNNAYIILSIN